MGFVIQMANVEVKMVKLSEIKLNPDNPRTISKKKMEYLVKSLNELPDMLKIRPIVVDETMTCLGGNMRTLALRKAGAGEATVAIVTGLTKEQKREFVIKDNAAYGEWNFEELANSWSDLPLADWGVDLPDDWLGGDKTEPADAPAQLDRAEELNKTWGVKLGDLWQIGSHRLLCGDSTKKEDVGRVMGGERADMVFTDPPYGIGKGIANDDLSENELREWNKKWIPLTLSASCDDAHFVCFHSTRLFNTVLRYAEDDGWKFKRYLTLYKPNDITFPWQGWILKSESILLFSKGNPPYIKIDPYLHDTMIYNNSSNFKEDVGGHPTVKLIGMVTDTMMRLGGDSIFDPFLGSGTTMVAAQNLNRKCRGIEISCDYVAVCLERMKTAFPGIEIKRL